jgi:hypothetical protein
MSREERSFFLKALATLAVPLALITLIPSCAGIVAVQRLTQDRADEAVRIAEAVQASRAELTYVGCLDQNARNVTAVKIVDNIVIARRAALRSAIQSAGSPAEAAALRAQMDGIDDSRAFTIELISAVVPRQDCEQLVLDRFGYVPDIGQIG